ncbi:MAG: hypothetical protein O7G31_11140 [Calditrichaeota bacterium]|nr:hypothetical protein [Calditrichota bacterium]
MSLKEILQKIVENGESILLSDNEKDWEASALLPPARAVHCRNQ